MKKINALSDIEWQIIKAVWEKPESTVRDVWEKAFPGKEKAYTTIQTYMDRMVDKGMLQKRKIGPVNLYQTLVRKNSLIKKATDNLMEKVFNGSFGQMAAFLVDSYDLTPKDLEEIKRMIEKKDAQL